MHASNIAMSSSSSPLSVVVDNTTGRKIAYDIVSLPIDEQQDIGEDGNNNHLQLDVLLLHGMAPVGRKCWGLIDHSGRGAPTKNGRTADENLTTLKDTIQSANNRDGNMQVKKIKFIMPDRPGYVDSDPAPEIEEDVGDSGPTNYSYTQFARDMYRIIEDLNSHDNDEKRHLIVLGTSSGGPCALAVSNLFWRTSPATSSLLGTILTSADCPYAHAQCPPEVTQEDEKDLNGRTHREYAQEESLKKFRRKSKAGFANDYLLERLPWGFEVQQTGTDETRKPVHMYVGGEDDYLSIRLGAPFLKQILGDSATLEILEGEDHFYASRKPEVLAKMILKMVDTGTK
mmetsp:Transcript_16568/g.34970  ORF Transcript_16568/g.34970 Transcript_16568/m.34970 type:complete len:343 (+) Transcript_16568:236-1264(+)